MAEQLGDPRIAVRAYHHRARAAIEIGDLSEAQRCVERQGRLADEAGEPTLRWMAAATAVGLPLAAGQFAEAEQMTVAAWAIAQDSQPDAQTYYAAQMLLIRYEQGRLEEVVTTVMKHVDDPEFTVPGAKTLAALMYCELERPDDSLRYYAPLAAERFTGIRFDHLWMLSLAFSAEVAAQLGDSESAAVLSDLLAPYSDLVVSVHSWPVNYVSHYLGLLATSLGRFDEAVGHFQATVEKQLHLGTPGWLAHTRLEWARMLLARGAPSDVEQAREMLSQVLATARELGMGNVERRTVTLLQ